MKEEVSDIHNTFVIEQMDIRFYPSTTWQCLAPYHMNCPCFFNLPLKNICPHKFLGLEKRCSKKKSAQLRIIIKFSFNIFHLTCISALQMCIILLAWEARCILLPIQASVFHRNACSGTLTLLCLRKNWTENIFRIDLPKVLAISPPPAAPVSTSLFILILLSYIVCSAW